MPKQRLTPGVPPQELLWRRWQANQRLRQRLRRQARARPLRLALRSVTWLGNEQDWQEWTLGATGEYWGNGERWAGSTECCLAGL